MLRRRHAGAASAEGGGGSSGILGASLTDVMFSQLVSLGKRLTDFTESSQGGLGDGVTESMDADIGVAVEFDSDASACLNAVPVYPAIRAKAGRQTSIGCGILRIPMLRPR